MGQIQYSDSTKNWYIPTHAVAQFAGGFGFLSAGTGYDFFEDRLSFDISFGYLPESIGGISITSLNSKTTYKPWHKVLKEPNITFTPVNFSALTMHAFGEQYTKFRKSGDYPQGYYWWPNSTRVGIAIGQSYFINSINKIRALELFWNTSTDDLLLYSFFENKVVKRRHIYSFDFGVKVYF